jgi:2-polyprenyl-6-methoxyphenol hydroxylase-like FAD-dependent oxidoreductase
LLTLHRDDQPFINDIMRATEGEIAVYPIYDIPSLPRWHKGPVVLIGDAAHATSPSAGQGASLALEDAIVLAQCLRDIPQLADAFVTYEGLRRKRAEKIVKFSRERGSNKALANPVARWFRDLMMPFFLKRFANATSFAWLYTYKVDWQQKVTKAHL